MCFELLNSTQGILKSSVMAEFSVALDLLEDWEEDSENAATPESFKTNDIEWVKNFISKKFFFGNELAASEALCC